MEARSMILKRRGLGIFKCFFSFKKMLIEKMKKLTFALNCCEKLSCFKGLQQGFSLIFLLISKSGFKVLSYLISFSVITIWSVWFTFKRSQSSVYPLSTKLASLIEIISSVLLFLKELNMFLTPSLKILLLSKVIIFKC